MKSTLIIAALLSVQAIQLTDDRGLAVDRFDAQYNDEMSIEMKKEDAES